MIEAHQRHPIRILSHCVLSPQFRGHQTYFFGVRCGVPETTRLGACPRNK
jgi:hypothetical protein